MSELSKKRRADRMGEHRTTFDKNRKRILMSQEYCAICGRWIDKSLPQYDSYAPQVDHIIPVAKGGHPSAIENLQLVHAICNRAKSDRLDIKQQNEPIVNPLAWSVDWYRYKAN